MKIRILKRILQLIHFCRVGVMAGLLGMAVGMGGYIYIMEFSDKTSVLLQAAVVFDEVDFVSFALAFVCMSFASLAYLYLEICSFWKEKHSRKIISLSHNK